MIYFTAAGATENTKSAKSPSKLNSESPESSNSFYSFSLTKYLNSVSNGCGSLAVRIFGCGPMDPGSTPGRGLSAPFSFKKRKRRKLTKKENYFKDKVVN